MSEKFDNMMERMDIMMSSLHTIANQKCIDDPTLPDKCMPAIKAIWENEGLSQDNYGDVLVLLTANYEIGSVYLTIDDPEDCSYYLRKQLKRYCKTM